MLMIALQHSLPHASEATDIRNVRLFTQLESGVRWLRIGLLTIHRFAVAKAPSLLASSFIADRLALISSGETAGHNSSQILTSQRTKW